MYKEIADDKERRRLYLEFARELAAIWPSIVHVPAGRDLARVTEDLIREEVDLQWVGGRVEFDLEKKTIVAFHPTGFSMNLMTGEIL